MPDDAAESPTPRCSSRRRFLPRWHVWAPPVACLAAAVALWIVFYPGMLSKDSISQYQQAVRHEYNDWHPPLLAICLSGVMALGGDIQHLVLGQAVLGVLGVFYLARRVLRFAFPGSVPPASAALLALGVLGLLLVPRSPLPIHLITYWKDVWLLIDLSWLGVVSLAILGDTSTQFNRGFLGRLAAFVGLAALAPVIRHNAIVLLPVFGGLLVLFVAQVVRWRYAVAWLLAPPLVYLGINQAIYRCFRVEKSAIGSAMPGAELVRLAIGHPESRPAFPYTSSYLSDNYRDPRIEKYNCIYWQKCVQPGYLDHPDQIWQDYWSACRAHPLWLARVKIAAFLYHFRENRCLKIWPAMQPNDHGLHFDPRFQRPRDWLIATATSTFAHPALRWLFTEHLVWFTANMAAVVLFLAAGIAYRNRRLVAVALLGLCPLGYYLSYLVFCPCADFRYMYPATVFVQVATLAWIAGLGLAQIRRRITPIRGWRNSPKPSRAVNLSGRSSPGVGSCVN
jgi:hypothetical protein